ncbi:hypothetical protein ACM0L0_01395 [Mycoplasma sp. 005V]|uniref:hypothetical protein n=1 Tax=Mycoplasma sp. 005V TaxID=3398776 RepID=UPI003A835142
MGESERYYLSKPRIYSGSLYNENRRGRDFRAILNTVLVNNIKIIRIKQDDKNFAKEIRIGFSWNNEMISINDNATINESSNNYALIYTEY